MSDNEMRDLCRNCLVVQHAPQGVYIGLDQAKAERFIKSFGWHDRGDTKKIVNEAMAFVSEVADSVVSEFKTRLRTTEDISGIDPNCP